MPFISTLEGSPLVFPRGGFRIAPASHVVVTEYDLARRTAVRRYAERVSARPRVRSRQGLLTGSSRAIIPPMLSREPVPALPAPASSPWYERWRPLLEATHLILKILKILGGPALLFVWAKLQRLLQLAS